MAAIEMDDAHRKALVATIQKCPLFHGLAEEQVNQVVAHAKLVSHAADTVITEQGAEADGFFLILSGEVSVFLSSGGQDAIEVARLRSPNTFGEMGLLLNQPRAAQVKAAGEVLLASFSKDSFTAMFSEIAWFGLTCSRALAVRLDQVNRRYNLPQSDFEGQPEAEVLRLLPAPFRERHHVLPLTLDGGVLTLGCVDDPSPQTLQGVRKHLARMEVRPVRINNSLYQNVMAGTAGVDDWAGDDSHDLVTDEGGQSPRLDAMLKRMVAEGASDLHLSAGNPPRWRVDGQMQALADAAPLGRNEVFELLEPVMREATRDEFQAKCDADFAYAVPGLARFRVNIYKDHRGVNVAMRQIPDKILNFQQLGVPETVQKFCNLPKGLVLVTGPTGSGKSSTLAAMLDHVNATRSAHVITMEDPIEFVHKSKYSLVNQRELGAHTGSFKRALRASLRQDPDIILVGEMRDYETVALVLEAAGTGHLVFATLHTSTAEGTINRIVGFFPPDEQGQIASRLADTLRGVVAQTLCRRQGGGRVAAMEILVANPAIENLIREKKTHQIENTMATGGKEGNILLNESLEKLIRANTISRDEGMAHTLDREDLIRRLKPPTTEPTAKPR